MYIVYQTFHFLGHERKKVCFPVCFRYPRARIVMWNRICHIALCDRIILSHFSSCQKKYFKKKRAKISESRSKKASSRDPLIEQEYYLAWEITQHSNLFKVIDAPSKYNDVGNYVFLTNIRQDAVWYMWKKLH